MACKDDWVLVDDMPTRFITWGAWIDDLKDGENLILLIPGNPGLVDFYCEFLKELHEKLQIPVWAVSHLGRFNLWTLFLWGRRKVEIFIEEAGNELVIFVLDFSLWNPSSSI